MTELSIATSATDSGPTIVRGGRIITAVDDYEADIVTSGGKIVQIGGVINDAGATVIDAHGMYVLPGAVDPHTHMDLPSGGTITCDDYSSGTASAAAGGTTTIVDFCFQQPGIGLNDSLDIWHKKLERCPPYVDVAFHAVLTDPSVPSVLDEVRTLPARGVTSCKAFMAYEGLMLGDAVLLQLFRVAKEAGLRTVVHAEMGEVIDLLAQEAVAAGHTGPKWHAWSHPPFTEVEAVERAIYLAESCGAPVYFVHISSAQSLDAVLAARTRGVDVTAETCTHYLVLDESCLDADGFDGAKYVFTPPPRTVRDRESLWAGLQNGAIDVVSSDHCPFNFRGQKELGRHDFRKIPNGAPGVEHRLQLLHHLGVRSGRLSLNRLVQLTSTNPARIFNLFPRKGTVAVGSDADLVIFDPEARRQLSCKTHSSRADYNLYEGMEVVGTPRDVLVRGTPVVREYTVLDAAGTGAFVRRDLSIK